MRKLLMIMLTLFSTPALAGEPSVYKDGDVTLEGWWQTAACEAPKGTVIVVHQWKGLGAYEKSRAELLSKECYNAFAADIYGQGIRPQNTDEAGKQATTYKSDADLARSRMRAALAQAEKLSGQPGNKIAIIGYCFGGTMALELARDGADFNTAIAFHGGLKTSKPASENGIKAAVVIHHGAKDPHVMPDELAGFAQEMAAANASASLYSYPDAVHSFTEKEAGHDALKGAAYNEEADKLSWARTLETLENRLK